MTALVEAGGMKRCAPAALDGLYEVEGRVTDRKPQVYKPEKAVDRWQPFRRPHECSAFELRWRSPLG
jgi:hypothetical protein